ncbi:MAG: hypothetical protein GF372_15145 [Candidatus Marinimicrobia bacterium]|nr:hypothetical protein [Candidatus Neomarinimicrobiota bacterium]
MDLNSFSADLRLAVRAAQEASEFIYQGFDTGYKTSEKGIDRGLVTEIDKGAENLIIKILSAESEHGVIGEEGGSQAGSTGKYWVIDPIDGTSNFVRNIPHFATAIALMEGSQVLIGVVGNPNHNELYYAEKGKGAFLNGRQISVSENDHPAWAIVTMEHGRTDRDRKLYTEVIENLKYMYSLRRFGASVIEICQVARGQVDGFICSGNELWDFAAASLLVTEAGGKFTDWNGDPWDGTHSFTLLSSDAFFPQFLEKVRGLQPEKASDEKFLQKYLPG